MRRPPGLRPWPQVVVAAVAAVLSMALCGPAAAITPAGWKDMLYSAQATDRMPLDELLQRFATTMGLQLRISDPELGARAVRWRGRGMPPATFLDQLSESEGLDWFVYQGVLQVSAKSAAVSQRLPLAGQSPAAARQALIGLGVLESKFGWGDFSTEPPSVLVTGPSAYVALVRRLLLAPAPAAAQPARRERPQVMVFRLRHASAADREIRARGSSVTAKGLVSALREILQAKLGTSNPLAGLDPFQPRGAARAPAGTVAQAGGGAAAADMPSLLLPPAAADGVLTAALPAAALAAAGLPVAGMPATPALAAQPAGAAPTRADADDDREVQPVVAAYTPLNAVLVWDLPSRREEYRQLIAELDVPTRQVEVNVTILDVNTDALKEWAVDFAVGGPARLEVGSGAAASGTGVSGSTMALWSSDRLALRLRALQSSGQAQVLSRPSVLTLDNVSALLDMSQSAFVKLVGERTADLRAITAGTQLRVTPSIVDNGASPTVRVTLDIEDGALAAGAEAPGTSSSSVSTEALVRPGESLVVGGYRRQNQQQTHNGIPVLDSLPLVGWLFRGESAIRNERERLFIVTTRVLN